MFTHRDRDMFPSTNGELGGLVASNPGLPYPHFIHSYKIKSVPGRSRFEARERGVLAYYSVKNVVTEIFY